MTKCIYTYRLSTKKSSNHTYSELDLHSNLFFFCFSFSLKARPSSSCLTKGQELLRERNPSQAALTDPFWMPAGTQPRQILQLKRSAWVYLEDGVHSGLHYPFHHQRLRPQSAGTAMSRSCTAKSPSDLRVTSSYNTQDVCTGTPGAQLFQMHVPGLQSELSKSDLLPWALGICILAMIHRWLITFQNCLWKKMHKKTNLSWPHPPSWCSVC